MTRTRETRTVGYRKYELRVHALRCCTRAGVKAIVGYTAWYLLEHAEPRGDAYQIDEMSHTQIAGELGVGQASIRKAIAELVKLGIVKVVEGGFARAHGYRFCAPPAWAPDELDADESSELDAPDAGECQGTGSGGSALSCSALQPSALSCSALQPSAQRALAKRAARSVQARSKEDLVNLETSSPPPDASVSDREHADRATPEAGGGGDDLDGKVGLLREVLSAKPAWWPHGAEWVSWTGQREIAQNPTISVFAVHGALAEIREQRRHLAKPAARLVALVRELSAEPTLRAEYERRGEAVEAKRRENAERVARRHERIFTPAERSNPAETQPKLETPQIDAERIRRARELAVGMSGFAAQRLRQTTLTDEQIASSPMIAACAIKVLAEAHQSGAMI